VRGIVEGRRLRLRHPVRTWLAADRGGVFQHGWILPVRYNVGRRCGRHLWSSCSMVASDARGSNIMTLNHGGGLTACFGSGVRGGHFFYYFDDYPGNESGAWCSAAGWRSPRTRERCAKWRVGGPRARECDVQRWKRRGPRAFGVFELSGFFTSSGGRMGCNRSVTVGLARQ
jgi:hypothetical protein